MKMKSEKLGSSKFLNLLFKPAGLSMGSTLRKRIMNPLKTLQAADVKAGETILEVGCGTGFFTIPAAQMIGEQGQLIAMDVKLKGSESFIIYHSDPFSSFSWCSDPNLVELH